MAAIQMEFINTRAGHKKKEGLSALQKASINAGDLE